MGGFYSLLTAQDGYSVVARISFYKFCEDADMKTLGIFAHFVDFCFRLRLCDDPQVGNILVTCTLALYILAVCAAPYLMFFLPCLSVCLSAVQVPDSTSDAEAAGQVSRAGVRGRPPIPPGHQQGTHRPGDRLPELRRAATVAVFDAMLKLALEKLLKVYRIFLLFEPAGSMLREQRVDIIAEAYDVCALIIQTATRRRQARKRVEGIRAAKLLEDQRRAEIALMRKKKAARY